MMKYLALLLGFISPDRHDSDDEEMKIGGESSDTESFAHEGTSSVVRYCICQQPEDIEDDRFMM